ncbi:energy transducer TonB [Viscerimonas tarda]
MKNKHNMSAKYLLAIPVATIMIFGSAVPASPDSVQTPVDGVSSATTPLGEQYKAAKDSAHSSVEVMPKFPGGTDGLLAFVGDNLKYPPKAAADSVQGRVFVGFVVSKDGSISSAKVIRGLSPETDAEALRVVGLMPEWTPGEINGKPVDVRYTLPIIFKLSDDEVKKNPDAAEAKRPAPKMDENGVYFTTGEEMPEFKGGRQKLMAFIANNLRYPVEASKAGIEGRVIVRFVVAKDGSVKDAGAMRSLSPVLDAEAIRVVNKMPKWTPGKKNGKPVDVYYTLPIIFRLRR